MPSTWLNIGIIIMNVDEVLISSGCKVLVQIWEVSIILKLLFWNDFQIFILFWNLFLFSGNDEEMLTINDNFCYINKVLGNLYFFKWFEKLNHNTWVKSMWLFQFRRSLCYYIRKVKHIVSELGSKKGVTF